MDKVDQREPTFECNDLNLTAANSSCFFDSTKPADCLFEERNKIIETNTNSQDSTDLNSVDCNDINSAECSSVNSTDCNIFNLRKKRMSFFCLASVVRYFKNHLMKYYLR